MIASAALQGVVSGEFATGNGLTLSTAPMMSNLFPAGANLSSTGEGMPWGYVCDPMTLCEKATGLAFSIEEAPCESTALLHAPWQNDSRDGCDSKETTPCKADQRRPLADQRHPVADSDHRAQKLQLKALTQHPPGQLFEFFFGEQSSFFRAFGFDLFQ